MDERLRYGVIGNGVDEADLQGAFGVQLFGGGEHFEGAGFADQARKALGAAPSGDEAESGTAMSEDGVRVGDAVTAGQCEIESAAHAVAPDGGAGWGGEVRDGIHKPLAHGGKVVGFGAGEGCDLVEVGTGREKVLVARNDKWFGRGLGGELGCCFRQREDTRPGESIGLVPGKTENGCAFSTLEFVEEHWESYMQRAEGKGQKENLFTTDAQRHRGFESKN